MCPTAGVGAASGGATCSAAQSSATSGTLCCGSRGVDAGRMKGRWCESGEDWCTSQDKQMVSIVRIPPRGLSVRPEVGRRHVWDQMEGNPTKI